MKFVNLTPHNITFRGSAGDRTFPASGPVARATEIDTEADDIDGMPTTRRSLGDVTDVPAPEAGTVYIVSQMCLSGLSGRSDVVAPDTGSGSVVRGVRGQIEAVTRWVVPPNDTAEEAEEEMQWVFR